MLYKLRERKNRRKARDMGMTKSAQEILAEWADPETGGTMPREGREAALSVLAENERLRGKLARARVIAAQMDAVLAIILP